MAPSNAPSSVDCPFGQCYSLIFNSCRSLNSNGKVDISAGCGSQLAAGPRILSFRPLRRRHSARVKANQDLEERSGGVRIMFKVLWCGLPRQSSVAIHFNKRLKLLTSSCGISTHQIRTTRAQLCAGDEFLRTTRAYSLRLQSSLLKVSGPMLLCQLSIT